MHLIIFRHMRRIILPSIVLVFVLLPQPARSQSDPSETLLRQVIGQLQTGTPNPFWYDPTVWQALAIKTQGSGILPDLALLGQVNYTKTLLKLNLPAGVLLGASAQHQFGFSVWVLGFNTVTRRIVYLDYRVGGDPNALPYDPYTSPPPPPPVASREPSSPPNSLPSPPANPPPKSSSSDACKRFPDLC